MSFCLSDGATLLSFSNEQETVQVFFGETPTQVSIPQKTAPVSFHPPITPNQPVKQGINTSIVAAIVGFFLLVIVALAAFILLKSDDKKEPANINTIPGKSPTSTPDDEISELKEKIANLENQDKKKTPTPKPSISSTPPPSNFQAARVKPTKDGFLALRSEPSSESGFRVTEMPSGATVYLTGSCQSSFTKIAGKSGRWCEVSYNGYSGWAFDAWLAY